MDEDGHADDGFVTDDCFITDDGFVTDDTVAMDEPAQASPNEGLERRTIDISSDTTDGQDEYIQNEENASDSDWEYDQIIKKARAQLNTGTMRRTHPKNLTRPKKCQRVGTSVVVFTSRLRNQQHDPFQLLEKTLVPGCKNAFERYHKFLWKLRLGIANLKPFLSSDQQKRKQVKNTPGKHTTTKETGKSGLRSDAWQWFMVEEINSVRYGICVIEAVDGEPCNAQIPTGTSTTALWRHLKLRHSFSNEGACSVSYLTSWPMVAFFFVGSFDYFIYSFAHLDWTD